VKRFLTGCWAIIKDAFLHTNRDCTLVWDGDHWFHDEGRNLLDDANGYIMERNEWQQRISDALGVTWQELHGGGATVYGDLDKCEERIKQLLDERDKGWLAAYERGLQEGRAG